MLSQRAPKSALRFNPELLRRKCYGSPSVPKKRLRAKCEEALSWTSKESEGNLQETFVECVEGFRTRMNDEFASVAKSFRTTVGQQSDGMRTYTQALLAIVEDRCASAISRQEAGYCIQRLLNS